MSARRGDANRGKPRPPAVAGMFYPDRASVLQNAIDGYFRDAGSPALRPKAVIAPHAGYIYSGPVAAYAYALLADVRTPIERVVLIGPSHYVPFHGLATTSADAYVTPLGRIEIDYEAYRKIAQLPQVQVLDQAHGPEHSLEVQLPFLQTVLSEFKLVPLVVGEANPDQVAEVLDALWGGEETVIVVSSDLSHYHPYQDAQRIDRATSNAILRLDADSIGPDRACGCRPVNGMLLMAKRKGLAVTVLDQRNSGDTSGDRSRVVGYGAYAFA